MLNEEEVRLLEPLRREAFAVKDCFTQHAFQAVAAALVVLGLVFQFQKGNPIVGTAGILVAVFCLGVVRVGIHKFETANRILGFDLYLHRRTRLRPRPGGWQHEMRQIGWEEAFYAWRVIQPKVFREIYRKSRNWVVITKPKDEGRDAMEWVGLPPKDAEAASKTFSAGNYLRNTIFVLHVVAVFALLPLVYMNLQLWSADDQYTLEIGELRIHFHWLALLVLIYTSVIVRLRVRRIAAKREILESGLLSINACAILWHAVVLAHFRALEEIEADRVTGWTLDRYRHYTDEVKQQAETLVDHLDDIYGWMDDAPAAMPQ